MSGHTNRDRVTVWPLDAWSKHAPGDGSLWWTSGDHRAPPRYTHIAWIEHGDDRGPLLRHQATGAYVMHLPSGAIRSVDTNKVRAALAALGL